MSNKNFNDQAQKFEFEFVLADSLIQARKRKKLTQKKLAEMIGTKQPVISRLETAYSLPSISLLSRISNALGTKLIIRFE